MDINKMEITPNGSDLTIRTGTAPKIIDPFDYQGFRYTALTPQLEIGRASCRERV